jgi:ribosome-associated protein
MVHVLVPDAREHYDIENIWADAEITEIPDLD